MEMIEIRSVKRGDEKALAHIQTESWRVAFAGIISQEELVRATDAASVEERYAKVLAGNPIDGSLLSVDGRPHCMAIWGKCRGEICPDSAELICIHSLQDNWGKGYGSMMMERVLTEMKEAGYTEAVLWVFEDNLRARRFYEKHGFALTDHRKNTRNAVEVMYHKVI